MSMTEKHLSEDMFEPAEIDETKTEEIATPTTGFWKDAMRRLFKNKGAVVGLILIILFIIMAIVGPEINKFGYKEQHIAQQFLPPKVPVLDKVSWLHMDGIEHGANKYQLQGAKNNFWLGTDKFGRDQWTRVWQGTRISLFIAFVAAALDYIVGVAYGGISAYFGGRTDNIMQRIIEVVMGIPNLVVIILVMMILQPGITAIIIAMIITGWVNMARIVRGQVLKLKGEEFVLASRTLGASHKRIILKSMIPNTAGQMIITTMFTIPTAIFFEAFLSFVGLGLQPPIASLGTLINDGFQALQVHPYLVVWPGIVISLILISFNLLGDGLRDAFDPRMRGRG